MATMALTSLRYCPQFINGRTSMCRSFSKTLNIPSDGPMGVGKVTSSSIPKHLRGNFDKVFKVQCVLFDFPLLIRDTPIKELVPNAQLISGFDPRHDRFQSSTPKHNARNWVNNLNKNELFIELQSRNLSFDGADDDDILKERLLRTIKANNDKWINGLFGREIREELKEMGLESQGKIEALHLRMSTAFLEGYGNDTSKHYTAALKNTPIVSPITVNSTESSSSSSSSSSITIKETIADNVYDESPLPKELVSITDKYRNKILKKTGGSFQSLKLNNDKGDAESLNIGRKALVGKSTKASKVSKWLPDSNVGDLLAYLETRSMKVYLLPNQFNQLKELETFQSHFPSVMFLKPEDVANIFTSISTTNTKDNKIENNEKIKKKTSFLSGFISSLTGSSGNKQINRKKSNVLDQNAIKSWESCINKIASELDSMDTGKILVVSDNNELLQASRELKCYTVGFNPPNQRKVEVTCDYSAEMIFDVKGCVEQENGISYRN